VLHEYGVTPGGLERRDGLDPVRDGKGRDEIIAAEARRISGGDEFVCDPLSCLADCTQRQPHIRAGDAFRFFDRQKNESPNVISHLAV
jgi:hypothetical protein